MAGMRKRGRKSRNEKKRRNKGVIALALLANVLQPLSLGLSAIRTTSLCFKQLISCRTKCDKVLIGLLTNKFAVTM